MITASPIDNQPRTIRSLSHKFTYVPPIARRSIKEIHRCSDDEEEGASFGPALIWILLMLASSLKSCLEAVCWENSWMMGKAGTNSLSVTNPMALRVQLVLTR